jgi:hypothetical protein
MEEQVKQSEKTHRCLMSKKTELFLLFVCILMISLGAVFVLLEWYPVSDGPPDKELCFLSFNLIFFMLPIFFAALGAYIVVPLAFMGFFFVKGKTRSVLLVIGIIFLTACLVAHLSRFVNWEIRYSSFERVSQRAEVVIQAIESYREHENKAPESLDCLVPEYIDTIPGTGIRAYPFFEYEIPEAVGQYHKDIFEKHNVPYELRVNCSIGVLNWDCFIYWPSESYPDNIYGGPTELINKWAYVHE